MKEQHLGGYGVMREETGEGDSSDASFRIPYTSSLLK